MNKSLNIHVRILQGTTKAAATAVSAPLYVDSASVEMAKTLSIVVNAADYVHNITADRLGNNAGIIGVDLPASFANYFSQVLQLFSMLTTANASDSDNRQAWQKLSDSYGNGEHVYAGLHAAIVALAGEDIVEHWASTGEVDLLLCDRVQSFIIKMLTHVKG